MGSRCKRRAISFALFERLNSNVYETRSHRPVHGDLEPLRFQEQSQRELKARCRTHEVIGHRECLSSGAPCGASPCTAFSVNLPTGFLHCASVRRPSGPASRLLREGLPCLRRRLPVGSSTDSGSSISSAVAWLRSPAYGTSRPPNPTSWRQSAQASAERGTDALRHQHTEVSPNEDRRQVSDRQVSVSSPSSEHSRILTRRSLGRRPVSSAWVAWLRSI